MDHHHFISSLFTIDLGESYTPRTSTADDQSGKRSAARSERGWYSLSTHAGMAPGAYGLPLILSKKSKTCRSFTQKEHQASQKTEFLHKKLKTLLC